jgi:hypothetical protein
MSCTNIEISSSSVVVLRKDDRMPYKYGTDRVSKATRHVEMELM